MRMEQFLQRLSGVRRHSTGYIARCPAHEDHKASLSLKEADGKILIHCHAECTPESVVAELGLTMGDLFIGTNGATPSKIVATYDYTDANGKLIFQTVRYEPKDFRQRRPNGRGGWTWSLANVERVMYRLPEVIAASYVLIVEGERDADTAHTLGLTATCNPGGAGKWRDEYSEYLRGKVAIVIADADTPGRRHFQTVAESLVGKAAATKVIEMPGAKDLTEWVEHGGTREQLVTLAANAAEWKPATNQNDIETTLVRECFTDITAKPVEWDWPERIPRAKLTIFSGDPDLGKSTVACDVIARRTTKTTWPDGAANNTEPGDVLLMIAEDDPEDTVKPRLMAADADLNRVHLLRCVRITQGAKKVDRMLALDQDLLLLEKELVANPQIRLVVIDPITNYFGRKDVNRDQELRGVLVPIKELADRTNVTFVGVGHFNKRSDVTALHRVGGAVAMSGVARAVWMFMRNPEVEGEYLMLLGKGNLTKKRTGLRYRITEKIITLPDGVKTGVPAIDWQSGESTANADETLAVMNEPGGQKRARAERFLMDVLADGDKPSDEIMAKGDKKGLKRTTLFAAKKTLGIEAYRDGSKWWWHRPQSV